MKPYKVLFLIPASAKKTLSDIGWIFETEDRLSVDVLNFLKKTFFLQEKEMRHGIRIYAAEDMQVSVIYDEKGSIEQISFQLRGDAVKKVNQAFSQIVFENLKIFSPDGLSE